MSENRLGPSAPELAVRASLAAADRQRRWRLASARLWRAAPAVGAAALLAAAFGRWGAGVSSARFAPFAAGTAAGLLLALAAYAYAARRSRVITDAAAAAIDADAELGGELRSASWFAATEPRDDWAEYHLARAAERLQGIDLAQLYPAVRAWRARVGTALMLIAALVIGLTAPEPTAARGGESPGTAPVSVYPELSGSGLVLSPELQRKLQELLAAAEAGDARAVQRAATDAELRNALNRLANLKDHELLDALARALAGDKGRDGKAEELAALAERTRRAAGMSGMSETMKEALEQLSDELELAQQEQTAAAEAGDPAGTGSPQGGDARSESAGSAPGELSIQFAKEAQAGGGAGVLMLSSPDQQGGGPPGAGVGGAGSEDIRGTGSTPLEAALQHETVAANRDNAGANIDTEIRRNTEHGDATVGFTRGASGRFDAARAAAPPPVPEARRPGVQNYFIRTQ